MAETLGQANPFRYRGYYYDTESGFYYLNSRYYDPEIGRFINADGYLSTGVGITGTNMFAYCNNNPVLFEDSNGNRPIASMSVASETTAMRKQTFAHINNRKKQILDITEKLDSAMTENSQKLNDFKKNNNIINTSLYFANKVKPDGEWDFKSQEDWNLSPEVTYYYKNKELRYDDIGNIHYGYVGSAVYSETLLLRMGGVIQILTRSSKLEYAFSNFDDPRDQEMIEFGALLWDLRSKQ